MKNSITFEKNLHNFTLFDFHYIPGKGFLGMTCKIDDNLEISAEYWQHEYAIVFSNAVKVGKEQIKGVRLPNWLVGQQLKDIHAKLKKDHERQRAAEKAKEESELDRLAEEVITGKKRLVVSAAGCLDVYYVCRIENESEERSQKILAKAILKTTKYGHVVNPDKYLGHKAREKGLQFKKSVSFMDLMDETIQRIENEKKHIADCIARAESTGEDVVIRREFFECNDPTASCSIDEFITYATPDGEVLSMRVHTY